MSSKNKKFKNSSSASNKKYRKCDWISLVVWVLSLIVAFIPIYVLLLSHLNASGCVGQDFWFECFVKEDTLWFFSTVLLIAVTNSCVRLIRTENKTQANFKLRMAITIIGIVFFVIFEATWLYFELALDKNIVKEWATTLSMIFSAIALVVSTPLQIEFIEGDKNGK